ncbi:hypothetical protein TSUD_149620 [Trifolium subterraneum]|uniref:Reverse transcriptase zinc-binding domain-containing protein n=1 Tax=Trifolium subterraneum TaxID=3900 RepID=A0A2Z6NUD6_TRISU|nr:hypothetical protein TSUD_149620 [Trifolium subterraneum]
MAAQVNGSWRVCQNVLSTQPRLKDKGVDCDPLCALCGNQEETTWHLFFHCSSGGECWTMNVLWEDNNGSMQSATHAATDFFSEREDWKMAKHTDQNRPWIAENLHSNYWTNPSSSLTKINIDTSFPSQAQTTGWGDSI